MRTAPVFLALFCSAATVTAAQGKKQSVEIGTSLGLTALSQSGESFTHVGIPVGSGPVAQPAIYATFFVTPSVTVEPQASLSVLSGGGSTLSLIGLGTQVGYLFSPTEQGSGYVAANGAFQRLSDDGSSLSGFGLGGALGYRLRVGTGFAVRLEARYRHWLSDFDGVNEFGLGIGLGGII